MGKRDAGDGSQVRLKERIAVRPLLLSPVDPGCVETVPHDMIYWGLRGTLIKQDLSRFEAAGLDHAVAMGQGIAREIN